MKGLDQFHRNLGGWWVVRGLKRVDGVVVVGLVGAFWKEKALCPFCILFS